MKDILGPSLERYAREITRIAGALAIAGSIILPGQTVQAHPAECRPGSLAQPKILTPDLTSMSYEQNYYTGNACGIRSGDIKPATHSNGDIVKAVRYDPRLCEDRGGLAFVLDGQNGYYLSDPIQCNPS